MANTFVGQNAEQFEKGLAVTVDRVIVKVGDDSCYYAPPNLTDAQWNAMTGKIITVTIPFGTQAIANSLLATLSSKTFRPYSAICGDLDPASEIGDYVTINGLYSLIANQTLYLNDRASSDFSASAGNVVTDKYPYLSKADADTQRKIAEVISRLSVAEDSIEAEVTARQGADSALSSRITQTATDITSEVTARTNADNSLSSRITQTVDSISSEVTARINADSALGTRIDQRLNSISLTVSGTDGTTSFVLKDGTTTLDTETFDLHVKSVNVEGTITADTVKSDWVYAGEISADQVSSGTFNMGSGYGYVGRGSGNNGVSSTTGVVLSSYSSGSTGLGTGDYYFIATNSGARMTGGNSYVCCTDDYVTLCGQNGYDIYVQSSAIVPSRNNSVQLGYSNYAWTVGYSYSWAEVSDRDKKENIDYDVSAYEALFDKLKPCKFNYISEDETKLVKTGFIAQDIEQAMTEIGMPMKEFDGLRFDYDEATGTKSNYSLCYNDIICLVVKEVQKLKARVAELETKAN